MDAEHWITAIITALVAIIGSGGIAALLQNRTNIKIGEAQAKAEEAAADKTAAEAWALLAKTLSEQVAQMQIIITALRERVEVTDTTRANLRHRVEELESKLADIEANRTNLRQRVEELEANKAQCADRIDDLEREIAELREWITKQGLTPPPRRKR